MASKYFDLIKVTEEAEAFVKRSFEIADQIKKGAVAKYWTLQDFADAMHISHADAMDMISGLHDFSTEEITSINKVLNIQIV